MIHTQDLQMVTIRELAALLSVSKATLHRMKAAGHLPSPVRLSPGVIRWRKSAILSWLRAKERPKNFQAGPRPRRNGKGNGPPAAPSPDLAEAALSGQEGGAA